MLKKLYYVATWLIMKSNIIFKNEDKLQIEKSYKGSADKVFLTYPFITNYLYL